MMSAETLTEQIFQAVLACPHTIIADEVTLRHDSRRPGHNALNQLHRRIDAAVKSAMEQGPAETSQSTQSAQLKA